MYILPNAKINIGLNVVSKRLDGYHDLQTVFYPIPFTDAIEIKTLEKSTVPYEFFTSGIPIPGGIENNLIVKVFLELKKEYNLPPLSINLAKHIPIEAGLGGGSSDCAHMMKLLNEFFSLGLSDEDMEKKVSRFGADCAFFIRNKPVFAEGLGDTFSQIDICLKDYFIVLVKPDISISTRQAFSAIIPHNPNNDLKAILSTEPISQWKYKISNIFESSIFPLFPNLQVIKETLYDIGAIYASMSGSGSTIYGIFDRPIENLCSIFPDCFTYSHRLS